jgi:hypothetical protein
MMTRLFVMVGLCSLLSAAAPAAAAPPKGKVRGAARIERVRTELEVLISRAPEAREGGLLKDVGPGGVRDVVVRHFGIPATIRTRFGRHASALLAKVLDEAGASMKDSARIEFIGPLLRHLNNLPPLPTDAAALR